MSSTPTPHWKEIGRLRQTRGVEGLLLLQLEKPLGLQPSPPWLALYRSCHWIPYPVEYWQEEGSEVAVQLGFIPCRTTAQSVVGCYAALPACDLPAAEEPQGLQGYSVTTTAGVHLGKVAALEKGSAYDWLRIEGSAGTLRLPFHADMVCAQEERERKLVVSLPEGYLETFTETSPG